MRIVSVLVLISIFSVCFTGCVSDTPMVNITNRFDKIETRLRINEMDINFYRGTQGDIACRLDSLENRVNKLEENTSKLLSSPIKITVDAGDNGGTSSFKTIDSAIEYLESFK